MRDKENKDQLSVLNAVVASKCGTQTEESGMSLRAQMQDSSGAHNCSIDTISEAADPPEDGHESSDEGEEENESPDEFLEKLDKFGIILETIYNEAMSHRLVGVKGMTDGAICVRTGKDSYRVFPHTGDYEPFARACAALHVEGAILVELPTVTAIIKQCNINNIRSVPIKESLRVQLVDTLDELTRARKSQGCAFVREANCLAVWCESPFNLVTVAETLHRDIINYVWTGSSTFSYSPPAVGYTGMTSISEKGANNTSEKSIKSIENQDDDYAERNLPLIQPTMVSLSIIMVAYFIGACVNKMVAQSMVDHNYYRFFLAIFIPWFGFASMFFCNTIVTNVMTLLGPLSQVHKNSLYYSCEAPPRLLAARDLPHITIQCPVYKESLESVIEPTMKSLRRAIRTYELQGGSASIFVNDDGMQLLDKDDQEQRRQYYLDNNIGWVARPPHGKDGFVRAGRFQKASNMNFCLNASVKVEKKLNNIVRPRHWTVTDEAEVLKQAVEEVCEEDSRIWAGGNIRVGQLILIVDSDTRVPEDCLLDAANEFAESPSLAILQFASSVMAVSHDYWENLIAFFTEQIYHAIRLATANGDVAAFVGHNAILRWSAIQEVSTKNDDGTYTFWSEHHVSEDFELSIKMHHLGYIVRYATYAEGFKEGVSLTVQDEITRWQKYAYGCSELLFNPFIFWLEIGPLTPVARSFLTSRLSLYSKWSILAYIGTYFAIGSVWILCILNYAIMAWYVRYVDKVYLDSFDIMLSIYVVFGALSSTVYIISQFRLGNPAPWSTFVRTVKYIIPMSLFFGSISFHVSMALLCHLFCIDMKWGSTAKELDNSNFFREVPAILKQYKWMYLTVTAVITTAIICQTHVLPYHWVVTRFPAIFPLFYNLGCHLLVPFLLNPQVMKFRF